MRVDRVMKQLQYHSLALDIPTYYTRAAPNQSPLWRIGDSLEHLPTFLNEALYTSQPITTTPRLNQFPQFESRSACIHRSMLPLLDLELFGDDVL